MDMMSNAAPDWPPNESAWQHPDGYRKQSSVGQWFEVRERRWVRVPFTENSCPGHVASDDPKVCRICGTHIDAMRPDDDD